MRLLVTGGSGFLGRHLLDHFRTTRHPMPRFARRGEPEVDLAGDGWPALLAASAPAVIFHVAGRLIGTDDELRRDNERTAARLFEYTRRGEARAARGPGELRGGLRRRRQSRAPDRRDLRPQAAGSLRRDSSARRSSMPRDTRPAAGASVARISNPVGPGMGDHLLCGTVARQVVAIERGSQDPVMTLGDLSPLRDFVHVDDVAAALWTLAQKGADGEAYNVAAGRSTPVREAVQHFLDAARVRPIDVRTVDRGAIRSALPEQWLDTGKLRALGWEPHHDLRGAVADLLAAERGGSS